MVVGTARRGASLRIAASYNGGEPTTKEVGGQKVNPAPAYPPALPDTRRGGWNPGQGGRGGAPPPGAMRPPPQQMIGGAGGAPIKWWEKLTSPVFFIATALALSVANPGYVDSTREMILFRLYEKESAKVLPGGQYQNAVMRDGTIYKVNKFSNSVTASSKDGLMVDKDGLIWVTVPFKNNPERVKVAYMMGSMSEVPTLKDGATPGEIKAYRRYMTKTFKPRFDRLPNLQKIYDAPERDPTTPGDIPVYNQPVRKTAPKVKI